MRKKILPIVLTITLVGFGIPTYSYEPFDDSQYVAALHALRQSLGYEDDPDSYWIRTVQRYQAVVIMSYLVGIQDKIYNISHDAPNFDDAEEYSTYIRQVMAFAMANPDLGFDSFDDGTFRPMEYATAEQIHRMMSLTYEFTDDLEIAWYDIFAGAAAPGLIQRGGITGNQFADFIAVLDDTAQRRHRGETSSSSSSAKPDCTGRKLPPGFHSRMAENFRINNIQSNRILAR